MTPLDRARVLDAEMQLQRAWLELNLRALSQAARESPWSSLHGLQLGRIGLSFLKHRSLWIAAATLVINLFRRHAHQEKT